MYLTTVNILLIGGAHAFAPKSCVPAPSNLSPMELSVHGQGIGSVQAGAGFSFPFAEQKLPAYSTSEAEEALVTPSATSYDQDTKTHTIQSAESFAEQRKWHASIAASGWGASVQVKAEGDSTFYSSGTHLTFTASTYLTDANPTEMAGCPALTEGAKQVLQSHGEEQFAAIYGTHFVRGFRSQSFAKSEITIKTSTQAETKRLALELSASYSGFGADASASAGFSSAMQSAASGKEIQTYFSARGVKNTPAQTGADVATMGGYLSQLGEHRDTHASRDILVLYPHNFCPEYRRLVCAKAQLGVVRATDAQIDELLQARFMVDYAKRTKDNARATNTKLYDLIMSWSPDVGQWIDWADGHSSHLLQPSYLNGVDLTRLSEDIAWFSGQVKDKRAVLQQIQDQAAAMPDYRELVPGRAVAIYSRHHERFLNIAKVYGGDDKPTGDFRVWYSDDKMQEGDLESKHTWERFKVVDGGNGQVALYSVSFKRFLAMSHSTMYASPELEENALPADWANERFVEVKNADGSFALWSPRWSRFVSFRFCGKYLEQPSDCRTPVEGFPHMGIKDLPADHTSEKWTAVQV